MHADFGVLSHFPAVSWVGLRCVNVAFPDQACLLFSVNNTCYIPNRLYCRFIPIFFYHFSYFINIDEYANELIYI